MDTDDIGVTLKRAVDSIRSRPAVRRRANAPYALVARAGYEEVRKLREDGYSYDVICEEFAKKDLLPEGANPKTLCSAFLREKKRRRKRNVQSADTADKPTGAPLAERVKPADDTTEKERIRKLTGTTVNMGLGNITKHADGSFEF